MYTVTTIINDQRVDVKATASSILFAAETIEQELCEQTQNLIVFAADACNWNNGITTPSVGIRSVKEIGGNEVGVKTDDVNWLVAGTLRWNDNDREIVRIADLMKFGYSNAYVDLRAQAGYGGLISQVKLGKRKIVGMHIAADRAYLTLAPMEKPKHRIGFYL